jgi:Bardet-Biedl syndrome 1 protein
VGSKNSNEKKNVNWLNAWYDPIANVKTWGSCIALADINGEGDSKLVIADLERKLKIYKCNFR